MHWHCIENVIIYIQKAKQGGEKLKDSKKNLIRDVTKDIASLPKDKQNYVLGVMNGMMITFKQEKEKEETKS